MATGERAEWPELVAVLAALPWEWVAPVDLVLVDARGGYDVTDGALHALLESATIEGVRRMLVRIVEESVRASGYGPAIAHIPRLVERDVSTATLARLANAARDIIHVLRAV